jgi:hypothetical protein
MLSLADPSIRQHDRLIVPATPSYEPCSLTSIKVTDKAVFLEIEGSTICGVSDQNGLGGALE